MTEHGRRPMPAFQCLILGDNGHQKEAFVRLIQEYGGKEEFIQGMVVRTVEPYTTRGPLCFRLWDVAGEHAYRELRRRAGHVQPHAIFLLYDTEVSCHGQLIKRYSTTPTILCGIKWDLRDLIRIKKRTQHFFDVQTSKLIYPFVWLGAKLLGDINLEVIPMPAWMPPDVEWTVEEQRQVERDLEEARLTPLPEVGDDVL